MVQYKLIKQEGIISRLYGAQVDEERWKVELIENDNNYDSYKLVDRKNEEIYFFNYIIGLEQVADNEFFVYRRLNHDDFVIKRYKIQKSKFIKLFEKSFSKFDFITDDRILFTYWGNTGPYRCGGIYSIKDNSMLKEADWLKYNAIEIHKDNEHPEKIKLYVEKNIYSYKLNNPKLTFTVDPNTLKPGSFCYSQLRDSILEVRSKEDIDKIEFEDNKMIRRIEKRMFQNESKQLQKAKEKLIGKN